jgi:hypothetical protein
MVPTHALDTLALAHAHGGHLRAVAAAERARGISPRRRSLAASLRRAAGRLNPTPLAPRPASQS